MQKLIQYLDSRGVQDGAYRDLVQTGGEEKLQFEIVCADDFEYQVSHFFNESGKKGYGLIPTNELLKTHTGPMMAIGAIEGDDVICMDLRSGAVYLWMIQTGEGEYMKAADSFSEFLHLNTGC